MSTSPKISVFPKCYFEQIISGEMNYLEWLRDAATLGAEGVEHYDGFFHSLEAKEVDPVIKLLEELSLPSSLLCFSPDFTHPEPEERARQVERQKAAIDLCVRLGTRYCRTLSGQAFPGMERQEGIDRVVECLNRSLEHAAKQDVILCMENHYKDGTWKYPEFAMPEDIYLEIVNRIDSQYFGVQYDPSNAIVGGFDPLTFLEKVKHRVVSMHASDRYLAEGATLDDLRQADGMIGYTDKLLHGETGKGLNDYDAIFSTLVEVGYDGWISVEDGINGLDEMERSVSFLKDKRLQYYS